MDRNRYADTDKWTDRQIRTMAQTDIHTVTYMKSDGQKQRGRQPFTNRHRDIMN